MRGRTLRPHLPPDRTDGVFVSRFHVLFGGPRTGTKSILHPLFLGCQGEMQPTTSSIRAASGPSQRDLFLLSCGQWQERRPLVTDHGVVALLGAHCPPAAPRLAQAGGGALIFQDLDKGETLAPESFCEGDKGGGKHLPVRGTQTGPWEAKSFGRSSAEHLKPRETRPPL